ncbi:hypothetical protein BH24ACT3_BH24ACT3_05030 [soil metagenome]
MRLITLPFRSIPFAVKSSFRLTGFAARTGYRTGRAVGYGRILGFGTGLAVGLLVAPVTGKELRTRLKRFVEGPSTPLGPTADVVPMTGRPTAAANGTLP